MAKDNQRRFSLAALAGTAVFCLLAGGALGTFFATMVARECTATRTDYAPDVFAEARERLEKITETVPLHQLEMTMASTEIYRLAEAEIHWLESEVVNSPGFCEAEYWRERNSWEARLETVKNTPSEFEGGTMESSDTSLRMADVLMERVRYLRAKVSENSK